MKKVKIGKKQWLVGGLICLLCLTGVVNYWFSEWAGNKVEVQGELTPGPTAGGDETAMAFYTTFRQERITTRNEEIAYLDSIIADTRTDAATLKKAQEQKMAVAKAMETEIIVEGLIKGNGFAECAVTIKEGSVNVIVKSPAALTSAQAAQIFEIVRTQTGVKNDNIKIMPRT